MSNIIKTLYNGIDTQDFIDPSSRNAEVELIEKIRGLLDDSGKDLLEELIQKSLSNNDKVCFEIYKRAIKDFYEIKCLLKI